MNIYVWNADYRSYGFSTDIYNGNVIPVSVPDDFSGGGKAYDPASGTWIQDSPYEPTVEDIAREDENRRSGNSRLACCGINR